MWKPTMPPGPKSRRFLPTKARPRRPPSWPTAPPSRRVTNPRTPTEPFGVALDPLARPPNLAVGRAKREGLMMKLFYSPGACSQAAHIVLHETGFSHDSARVDLRAKTVEDGSDYLRINPKGAVPALELENGEVLTENAVILQYLGDRSGSSDLFPPLGDFRRYRVLEWLNYVATELHKGFGPLWNPAAASEWKQATRDLLAKKFDFVEQQLGDQDFLTGSRFTI